MIIKDEFLDDDSENSFQHGPLGNKYTEINETVTARTL